MSILVLGLVAFFLVHSISIANRPWRDRMVARVGEMPWKGLYSLFAIVGLALIVYGYGLARPAPIVLYDGPAWLGHLALLLLVPVFPLLIAAYLPTRIRAAVEHPMLVAVKLWALAHLLVNGTVADVLLFGSFLVWAVADRIALEHRQPQRIPVAPETWRYDAIAVAGGLAGYALFVWRIHHWLTGVAPI